MELYNKSYKNGQVYSLTNIGTLYKEGAGVPIDYEYSMKCFQLASKIGKKF